MPGVTRPLSHRPRKLHTRLILVTIWTVSTVFAAPLTVFYRYEVDTRYEVMKKIYSNTLINIYSGGNTGAQPQ